MHYTDKQLVLISSMDSHCLRLISGVFRLVGLVMRWRESRGAVAPLESEGWRKVFVSSVSRTGCKLFRVMSQMGSSNKWGSNISP